MLEQPVYLIEWFKHQFLKRWTYVNSASDIEFYYHTDVTYNIDQFKFSDIESLDSKF